MKKLLFEGIGWVNAEDLTNVSNNRIRTRIKNNEGRIIYLEISSHKPDKNNRDYKKGICILGHVDHCCYDDTKWDSPRFKFGPFHDTQMDYFEYEKDNILDFVNKRLKCSFDDIEVCNDGRFRVHDTDKPLCDCSSGNCQQFCEVETNISVLDNVPWIFPDKRESFADYKLNWETVKELPHFKNWIEKHFKYGYELFQKGNFYARLRWDKNGTIIQLEVSAREQWFVNMEYGPDELPRIIDAIIRDNK